MQIKFYSRFIVFMSGFFTLMVSYGQPAGFLFKKTIGGNNQDNIVVSKQTLDGGFVLAGVTNSKDGDVKGFKGGSADIWVVKLSSAGILQWQKCLGGGNLDKGTIIHELTAVKNGLLQSDGFIVGGTTSSSNGDVKGYKGGTSDMWVVRLSVSGAIVWQRTIGGTGEDEVVSLKPVNDGGFIVAGNTKSTNGDISGFHGGKDIVVVKISSAGVPVWRRTLGNSGYESINDLEVLEDGSLVILSRIGQATPGGDITEYKGDVDYWVCRLSGSGGLLWQKTLGGSGNENAWSMLRIAPDGHLAVCGSTTSFDGDLIDIKTANDLRFWVVKLNISSGSIIWNWADQSGRGNLYGSNNTSDGGLILTGSGSDGDASTLPGGKMVKLSAAGNMQWSKDFGYATGSGEFAAVQETSNGDFIALGATMFRETPGMHSVNDTTHWPDLWVVRVNSAGEKIWDQAYGGKGEEWYGCNLPTLIEQSSPLSLNNYWDDFLDANDNIFTGLNTNSNDGDVSGLHAKFGSRRDIWFVRLNTGTTLQTQQVRPLSLVSTYPNPTRHSTFVSFKSNGDEPVLINVFNSLGKLVQQKRIAVPVAEGMNSINIDLGNCGQGLYIFTIVQGYFRSSGKIIVQR